MSSNSFNVFFTDILHAFKGFFCDGKTCIKRAQIISVKAIITRVPPSDFLDKNNQVSSVNRQTMYVFYTLHKAEG